MCLATNGMCPLVCFVYKGHVYAGEWPILSMEVHFPIYDDLICKVKVLSVCIWGKHTSNSCGTEILIDGSPDPFSSLSGCVRDVTGLLMPRPRPLPRPPRPPLVPTGPPNLAVNSGDETEGSCLGVVTGVWPIVFRPCRVPIPRPRLRPRPLPRPLTVGVVWSFFSVLRGWGQTFNHGTGDRKASGGHTGST